MSVCLSYTLVCIEMAKDIITLSLGLGVLPFWLLNPSAVTKFPGYPHNRGPEMEVVREEFEIFGQYRVIILETVQDRPTVTMER